MRHITKMLFYFWMFSLILSNIVLLSDFVEANDFHILQRLRDRIESNYGGIVTWSGEAIIQKTITYSSPIPSMPQEQYTEYLYHFTFDKAKNNYFSSAELNDEYSIFENRKDHLLLPNTNYMKVDDIFFSLYWQKKGQKGKTSDGTNFFDTEGDDIERVAIVHSIIPPTIYNFFDPFANLFIDERRIVDICDSIIESMKKRNINLQRSHWDSPEGKIQLLSHNDCITLEILTNKHPGTLLEKYVFDLKQGGNIILYNLVYENGKSIQDMRKWICSYQMIDNFWLPKSTEVEHNDISSGSKIKELIHWKSNTINSLFSSTFFSPQKLGLHRGDSVYDERTQTTTVITGDDFPPSFHAYDAHDSSLSITRWCMIIVGLLMIITSSLIKYRQWHSYKKIKM